MDSWIWVLIIAMIAFPPFGIAVAVLMLLGAFLYGIWLVIKGIFWLLALPFRGLLNK